MTAFSVSGSTLPDLFQNASGQLLALVIDPAQVSEAIREKIALEAPNGSVLLRDWINALLSLAAHQRIIVMKAQFREFQAQIGMRASLKADVAGELIDPLRHTFRKNPASLNCVEAAVEPNGEAFAARLIISTEID